MIILVENGEVLAPGPLGILYTVISNGRLNFTEAFLNESDRDIDLKGAKLQS